MCMGKILGCENMRVGNCSSTLAFIHIMDEFRVRFFNQGSVRNRDGLVIVGR
jgi:hypothetical protein